MPTEMRQIAFKQAEIVRALIEYDRRRTLQFPTGGVKHIEIVDDPEIRALVTINTMAGEAIDVIVGPEPLAAALILFCINQKIPLPVEADKRLQKVGDGVALFVVKRHTVSRPG